MSRYRVYLKTFDLDGETYLDDYTEITDDVVSVGDIQQGIDNSDFNVGVIRASNLRIVLKNDLGKYSAPGNTGTVFTSRIKDSYIKVTWDARGNDLVCGFFQAGKEILGGEVEIFEGLINNANANNDARVQTVDFTVLGMDALLNEDKIIFPGAPDIFSLSALLYLNLRASNGSKTSRYASVYLQDFGDPIDTLVPNYDFQPDPGYMLSASEANKTIGEELSNWMLGGNSVLLFDKSTPIEGGKDYTIYVKGRIPTADVKFTFKGNTSLAGAEDSLEITKYSDGVNRVFNFWVWEAESASDQSSINTYGYRKKSVSADVVTADYRQGVLDNNLAEFRLPKIELELICPMWYNKASLKILDRVNLDFPPIYIPAEGSPIPYYGEAMYGEVRYPYVVKPITIPTTTHFKILGKKISPTRDTVTFKLREV